MKNNIEHITKNRRAIGLHNQKPKNLNTSPKVTQAGSVNVNGGWLTLLILFWMVADTSAKVNHAPTQGGGRRRASAPSTSNKEILHDDAAKYEQALDDAIRSLEAYWTVLPEPASEKKAEPRLEKKIEVAHDVKTPAETYAMGQSESASEKKAEPRLEKKIEVVHDVKTPASYSAEESQRAIDHLISIALLGDEFTFCRLLGDAKYNNLNLNQPSDYTGGTILNHLIQGKMDKEQRARKIERLLKSGADLSAISTQKDENHEFAGLMLLGRGEEQTFEVMIKRVRDLHQIFAGHTLKSFIQMRFAEDKAYAQNLIKILDGEVKRRDIMQKQQQQLDKRLKQVLERLENNALDPNSADDQTFRASQRMAEFIHTKRSRPSLIIIGEDHFSSKSLRIIESVKDLVRAVDPNSKLLVELAPSQLEENMMVVGPCLRTHPETGQEANVHHYVDTNDIRTSKIIPMEIGGDGGILSRKITQKRDAHMLNVMESFLNSDDNTIGIAVIGGLHLNVPHFLQKGYEDRVHVLSTSVTRPLKEGAIRIGKYEAIEAIEEFGLPEPTSQSLDFFVPCMNYHIKEYTRQKASPRADSVSSSGQPQKVAEPRVIAPLSA